ncbi:MAG: hypothetical protein ABSG11_07155 [Candidatus Korobacteraceae bacterium]|jgi:hypothetical protein
MEIDYKQLLYEKFLELGEKIKARDALEFEIAKLNQFVRATLRMLPEKEQEEFEQYLNELDIRSGGLTDAIKRALQAAPKDAWITGPALRQRLIEAGFDFSQYTSNPLASIYSVAKRFKPTEVKTEMIEGIRSFRWVGPRRREVERLKSRFKR